MMSNLQEPIFDVAQLAHVEILSPKPEETVKFFNQFLGMEVSEVSGQSVYLRAYEDFYHHTLKVTESREAGLGHVAWRTSSPNALERRVNAIKAAGLDRGWIEGDHGHGEAYQFTTPDGHLMELLWDVEYFRATEDKKTELLNRPQKRPDRGVPVRRLDHVNLMAADAGTSAKFMMETLGFRLREQIVDDAGTILGSWISVSNLAHDIAIMHDPSGIRGRFHHICYWYGVPQNLYDIAELLKDNDIFIEAGPKKHGISQAFCLYVYEPGGNRVELFGDAGYLIFDPTWEPVVWNVRDVPGKGDVWIGGELPESFWTYGTPAQIVKTAETQP
ncbi:catechol 2,3-dioxygenase [Parageobacillus thermoglucosidasius]|uniref:catechol 2,3-dioxygenase n=1 Tax=Parageobacillus thermoglucosidasius TaxID=1426 RepID=UPI003CC67EAE